MWKEHFEDCHIGDRTTTPGRTITEADVVLFAAFSSDWNSVHVDREYAGRHTPFGQRIAHGLLGLVAGFCLLSRQGWFSFWPASMICITKLDKVRFQAPVFLGDTIRLEAEIIEMLPMDDDAGLITTRMEVKNQRDELVIAGRLQLKAGRRPVAEAASESRGE